MVKFLLVIHLLPFTWIASLPKPNEISTFVHQNSNDLEFGNAQVEQFIRDRPDTADIIRRHSMLRWMLIWNFAGELKRGRIYWDHIEPEDSKANHSPASNGYPSSIRVSKDQSAIDQCAMLLFELFNSEIDLEYIQLSSSSADDRKSKDEFVTCCVRDEFNAMQKVQTFFIHHPIGADTRNATWYLSTVYNNCDFPTFLSDVKASERAYLEHYEGAYDQIIKYNK